MKGLMKSARKVRAFSSFATVFSVYVVKNSLANTGDTGDSVSIPGSGRSSGGGHCNPFQYSCLEDPMDRGGWQATVHRVAKSQTRRLT